LICLAILNNRLQILKSTHLNEQSDVASKSPASLFEREAEVLFGALKTKSCLSEASSFCLAQKSAGVAQKVQTAVFLFCYLFSFCRQKEKSKKQTITKKILPLHKQKKKTCIKKQSITI